MRIQAVRAFVLISFSFFIFSICTLIKTSTIQHAYAIACPYCRDYSQAELTDTNYTAVYGTISYAIPAVRDNGFSAETLWIGANNGSSYIEVGWRRPNSVTNSGNPFMYWTWTDSIGRQAQLTQLSNNYSAHNFSVEHHTSDNNWYIYVDGGQAGYISATRVGVSSGSITAGGEVTDFVDGQHNAMGVSNFTNLRYQRSHSIWYSWASWNTSRADPGYSFIPLSGTAFQNYGYNP